MSRPSNTTRDRSAHSAPAILVPLAFNESHDWVGKSIGEVTACTKVTVARDEPG